MKPMRRPSSNHATLGRLLIFDATDPYTSLGDLPDHEQGSYALIIAGQNGGTDENADHAAGNRSSGKKYRSQFE